MTSQTRKERSEIFLTATRVTVNHNLPALKEYDRIKPPADVARRTLILVAILNVIKKNKPDHILAWLKKHSLLNDATVDEKVILQERVIHDHDRLKLSWRAEAVWVFLWALGIVPDLGLPVSLCDLSDPKLWETIPGPGKDPASFLDGAALRPVDDILNMRDLLYRIHWAVTDALLNRRAVTFNHDVVYEWHYALNWIADPLVKWQDVKTNT
jgi:hypothetical protein